MPAPKKALYGKEIAGLQSKVDDLLTLVDGGTVLSEDQVSEMETATTEIKRMQAAAETIANSREQSVETNNFLDSSIPARGPPATPGESSIEVGLSEIEKDPMHGFKSTNEFFGKVYESGKAQEVVAKDERLQYLSIEDDGQNSNNNPSGNFLVPEPMAPGLLTRENDADVIGVATTKVPMASSTLKFPARVDDDHNTSVSGGLKVYRREEEEEIKKSQQKYHRIMLELNNLDGACFVTDELIQDSPISIPALIGSGFDEEFIDALNMERLYGSGSGEYLGITESPCYITIKRNTADRVLMIDVLKMIARHWNRGGGGNMWLANKMLLPQIAQLMITSDNGNAATPAYLPSVNGILPDMLMGMPIYFREEPKPLGQKNDLILTNWSQYLEGTKGGMTSAQSMHVRFLYNEQVFKFGMRNDGRPWWKAPLKPKHGADTISPFVGLDVPA